MPNILTRAPRWAWYTTGGVVLAGSAFQLYKHREARTAALAGTADAAPGDGTGGAGSVGIAPSPAPGIVVPPVIIPGQQQDPLAGVQPLQDLYIGAVSGVIQDYKDLAHGWSDVYTPIITQLSNQNDSLIGTISTGFLNNNAALLALAQAGQAPGANIPSPIVGQPAVAPAPALPAPPSCPPGFPEGSPPDCFRTITPTDCHCEGTGANRKCWTRRLHEHQHQSGAVVVVSVDKVRDGC